VFVKGKGAGMGSGTGTFTADAIVILPSVAKAAAYQSLLKTL